MYDHHKRCFETRVISQLYVVCLLRDRNSMIRNANDGFISVRHEVRHPVYSYLCKQAFAFVMRTLDCI